MPVFRPKILHEALPRTSEPSGSSELATPVHGSLLSYLGEGLLKAGSTNPCAYLQQQDNNMAVEWRTRATSGSSQFRFAVPVPTLGRDSRGKLRANEFWSSGMILINKGEKAHIATKTFVFLYW